MTRRQLIGGPADGLFVDSCKSILRERVDADNVAVYQWNGQCYQYIETEQAAPADSDWRPTDK